MRIRREEGHVTMGVQTGVKQLLAEGPQGLLITPRSWKRPRGVSPAAFRGSMAIGAPRFLMSGLQNWERIPSCFFRKKRKPHKTKHQKNGVEQRHPLLHTAGETYRAIKPRQLIKQTYKQTKNTIFKNQSSYLLLCII